MQPQPKRRSGSLAAVVVLVIGLLVLATVWYQRFALYDWARLRNYQPSAKIAQLATDTTMKDGTRRTFYAYHPVLETQESFNQHCQADEKTAVLGCYVRNRGIYLYEVPDARLKGVAQVTAAHEVLHAFYDRLSSSERKRVNDMTTAAYAKVTDERIRSTIQSYQDNGADVPNELHSILGTEVRELPAELEAYYARYFTDRSKIVGYLEQYEQEFSNRRSQITTDDARLNALKQQIEQLTASLDAQASRVNTEYARLQSLKRAGKIEEYNAAVNPYNALYNQYRADYNQYKSLLNEYNTLVGERNAIAAEESQLYKALDSRPSAVPAQ